MDNLPSIILTRIIYFSEGTAKSNLSAWKAAFPLLAINRALRFIARQSLFSCAIIDVKDNDEYKLESSTNIALIRQLGLQAHVRRFAISNESHVTYIDSWIRFVSSLEHNSTDFSATSDAHIPTLAKDMALIMSQCLPNVVDLMAKLSSHDLLLIEFVNSLVECYIGKLLWINCTFPVKFPTPHVSAKATSVRLTLPKYFNTNLPLLDQRSLKYLHLDIRMEEFYWNMFCQTPDANTIAFDNLRRLHIWVSHRLLDSNVNMHTNAYKACQLELLFPRLTELVLRYRPLKARIVRKSAALPFTTNNIKHLAQSPLEKLDYQGCLNTAFILCSQKLNNLRVFKLSFNYPHYHFFDDDFIEKTNHIFGRTSDIAEVRFTVGWPNAPIQYEKLYWPYLTHLRIVGIFDFNAILSAIPNMPRLVYLTLQIDKTGSLDPVILTLNNLKNLHPKRTSSLIRKVTISFSHASVDVGDSLRMFRWFLPKLRMVSLLKY